MNSYSTPRLASIPPVMPNEFTGDRSKTHQLGYIYESLACYYLACIGIKAEVKDGDGYDLLCESPDGSFFKAEVKASSGWIQDNWKPVYNYAGLKNKETSSVFIFMNATTNHCVIKFKNEMGNAFISGSFNVTSKDFSDYQTQLALKKLADVAGVVNPDAPIMEADEEEKAQLTRDWLFQNADKIQTMQDAGLSGNDIAEMFSVTRKYVFSIKYVNDIKCNPNKQSISQLSLHI